jgi:4-diphosphocytidyl-2-C-methyl-D-erythritol kinase
MIHIESSGKGTRVFAPAKLNLFLEVLGKRPDGYHELETLMVATDWFDELTFENDPTGRITFECDDPALPTDGSNLVVRAAERLRDELGEAHGARIKLQKTIPAEAGLAGGSSDAAATLLGLAELWGRTASLEHRIEAIAAEIGSDVPFFTRRVPAAICRGRGERVEPLPMTTTLELVIICPFMGVRTADAYARVSVPSQPRPIAPVMDALESGDTAGLGRLLFNRLQPAAESLAPALEGVREAMAQLDSEFFGSAMSGSGSAYFGLARSRTAARTAASTLERLGLGRVRAVTCGPRDHLA